MTELREEVAEVLSRLCEMREWSPHIVADLLGRRLQLRRADEVRSDYDLVGGVGIPFGPAEIRWPGTRSGAFLNVHIARGVHASIREVSGPLRARYPSQLAAPDPLCGEGGGPSFVLRTPAGELWMKSAAFSEDPVLTAFSLGSGPP